MSDLNIQWKPVHSSNYGNGRSGNQVRKIVLHWIVGTLESAYTTFSNPDRNASSHYGIGDDDIWQFVDEQNTAWHAGDLNVNMESIGIEHEGGWLLDDGSRKVPTDKTVETSAKLVADICKRYNIPIDRDHITVHRDHSATACPGTLNVERIINLAKEINVPETPDTNKRTLYKWGYQGARPNQEPSDSELDWRVEQNWHQVDMIRDVLGGDGNSRSYWLEKWDAVTKEAAKLACDNAISLALSENNAKWQSEMESAKQKCDEEKQELKDLLKECEDKKCEDYKWYELIEMGFKKMIKGWKPTPGGENNE